LSSKESQELLHLVRVSVERFLDHRMAWATQNIQSQNVGCSQHSARGELFTMVCNMNDTSSSSELLAEYLLVY
jgi:hypothetical protein